MIIELEDALGFDDHTNVREHYELNALIIELL
jgi:hypothetical protein